MGFATTGCPSFTVAARIPEVTHRGRPVIPGAARTKGDTLRLPNIIRNLTGAAVVGLLTVPAIPAQAAHDASAPMSGTFSTSGNLWSARAPGCTAGGLPAPCPTPGHVNWSMSAHGMGESTSTGPTSLAAPDFSIHGTGSMGPDMFGVGPYCGVSSGSGTFHWSFTGGVGGGHHGSVVGHWAISPGGTIAVTAGGVNIAMKLLDPTPAMTPTESCLAGTAKNFAMGGNFKATTAP